jgi:carboxyl-terminal processing protease
VGETTWGKGLVQTVYPLSQESALALTTAKYYTPSGRLIQRDYHSLEDYFSYADTSRLPEEEREVRFTDSGRKVLGGGGISPDVEIKIPDAPEFVQQLERKAVFFDFAVQFLVKRQVGRDFQPDDTVLAQFQKMLVQKKIDFKPEDIKDNLDFLRKGIRVEVIGNAFGLEERNKALADIDPQILKALDLFPRAQAMLAAIKRAPEPSASATPDSSERSSRPQQRRSAPNLR